MPYCLFTPLTTATKDKIPNEVTKQIIETISGLELLNSYFPVMTDFKSVYAVLLVMTCFPPYSSLPHKHKADKLSLPYCYIHDKCRDELHSLVLPVQFFTAKIRHSTPTRSSHLHISFVFH